MSQQLLDLMEQAFSSMDELYAGLDEHEWALPTDLPGWTVHDQLSHIIGIETWLLGRPRADVDLGKVPEHVRNALGESNEREILVRRGRPPQQQLDEYREVTGERLKALTALTPEQWDEPSETPIGPGRMRDLLAIRVLDVFFHEQDARRATKRPGHLNGDVARHTFERMTGGLPMIVGKRAGAPEGSAVVFSVPSPGREVAVGVSGGRGAMLDAIPSDPTVRLATDVETYLCLVGGRWTAERALSEDRVTITGDRALGEKVLSSMNVMI